jgi:hypothetical protein
VTSNDADNETSQPSLSPPARCVFAPGPAGTSNISSAVDDGRRVDAMNALQEKCRPKHQVLVLKCYPRTTKGAVDVKANSSELSYLLFYATSRRSKIQKIGSFLEKKTASDVWRVRIGYAFGSRLENVESLC